MRKKRSKIYTELKKAYKDLKESYIETILRFTLASNYKDEATGGHLVRIADYSVEIAKELGLSKKKIEIIKYASPMHDVGKIATPDAIIRKKGPLTPKERAIINRHTTVGANMFKDSSSPLLKAASIISLTHHEKYDGTGYPGGLKGDEIPLFGRIVALADVFDALTFSRFYKKAYGFEESFNMILKESGNHFDPDIVKAFIKRKKRIKRIWQANRDIASFVEDNKI